jgi:hypothetical protein
MQNPSKLQNIRIRKNKVSIRKRFNNKVPTKYKKNKKHKKKEIQNELYP